MKLRYKRQDAFVFFTLVEGLFFPVIKIHFSLRGRLLKGKGKEIRARDRAQGKHVFILLYLITLQVWKCGNLEMCFSCFNLITLEVWKSEMWKSGNVSGMPGGGYLS